MHVIKAFVAHESQQSGTFSEVPEISQVCALTCSNREPQPKSPSRQKSLVVPPLGTVRKLLGRMLG